MLRPAVVRIAPRRDVRLIRDSLDLFRDLPWGHDEIDTTGANGRIRHACESCGLLILRECDAAFALDRTQAKCAIRSAA